MLQKRTQRRWILAGGLMAVLTGVSSPAGNRMPAPRVAGTKAVPAEEVAVKSPGEIASQVCVILHKGKTPWQLYRTYVTMFQRFAERQARTPVGTQDAQKVRSRMVLYYQNMANLLLEMQKCAEVRDGIKHNKTDIPFGERQKKYAEAGKRHDALLRQFIVMGSKLPGFKLPTRKTASASRGATGSR